MTKSFKEFRTEGFQDRSGDYDSDDPSTTIKARHAAEAKKAAKQYRNDTSAMLELRDILDELESLRKLLEQQEESIGGMVAIYNKPTFKESGANGKSILEEAQEKLKGYISHVEQLKKSAEKTREDVSFVSIDGLLADGISLRNYCSLSKDKPTLMKFAWHGIKQT